MNGHGVIDLPARAGSWGRAIFGIQGELRGVSYSHPAPIRHLAGLGRTLSAGPLAARHRRLGMNRHHCNRAGDDSKGEGGEKDDLGDLLRLSNLGCRN
jgi:hypothetical protein